MDFLTSTVLSGIAWDGIKSMGYVTGEYLKNQLKEWMLDEKSYETIVNKINDMPEDYKKSKKFLEAAIDDDTQLQNILKLANGRDTYGQDNSGTFDRCNVVSGKNHTITINNSSEKKKPKLG
ncbi:hypothetical protein BHV55_04950 [Bacillus sp. RZ2MS9]|uniref:hypothetical protein n=1 Tax=Bacillus sp. RZ2MS9 TaxID=1806216 RepID=UPI0008A2A15A|nr:hypothetical protein [Bacillus sp. RZ2MS9]QIZ41045.1 hypothetical protein BHV55_04950 [Bacillus sp. RZ2MS9]